MKPLSTISYRPEWTDRGWLIWRAVPGKPEAALPGRALTQREAEEKILSAVRADAGAATRLGLRVVTDLKHASVSVYAIT